MDERELLLERLGRLAIVLDEIMPRCAKLVRDTIAILKEKENEYLHLLNEFENVIMERDALKEKVAKSQEFSEIMHNMNELVKPYLDFDGHDVWRCGNCNTEIYHPENTQADEDAKNYILFCKHCGKGIKWD